MIRPLSTLLPALRGLLPAALGALLPAAALAQIQLEVVVNPDPARPGEILDVEFTVTNDGGSDRHDVSLVWDYPQDLFSLSETLFDGDCPSTGCDPL